jgi:chloramphenicol-sensitive protein RarD
MAHDNQHRIGGFYALSAYLWWGFLAVYIKQVAAAAPVEIITHRILWTCLTMAIVVGLTGRAPAFAAMRHRPKAVALLALSGFLIASNWLIFVWAVNHGRIHDTSMGYFINPLLIVLVGLIVLRERLRPWQALSLGMASLGVMIIVARVGVFPWIALSLAITFTLYSLVRKQLDVDPLVGLLCETLALFPLAAGYFLWLAAGGQNTFGPGQPGLSALLILAGPMTAVPLVLFSAGARRITMTTLGFFQYLTPSITFCLAIFAYGEQLSPAKLAAFVCIWIGLFIYTADTTFQSRLPRRQALEEA